MIKLARDGRAEPYTVVIVNTETPHSRTPQETLPADRVYIPPATNNSYNMAGIITGAALGFAVLLLGIFLLFKWNSGRLRRLHQLRLRRKGKGKNCSSDDGDGAGNGMLPQGRHVEDGPEYPLHQIEGAYDRVVKHGCGRGSFGEALKKDYFTTPPKNVHTSKSMGSHLKKAYTPALPSNGSAVGSHGDTTVANGEFDVYDFIRLHSQKLDKEVRFILGDE